MTQSCVSTINDTKNEPEDIWDKALEADFPEYYQWEAKEK
jgi:hypothetical protein